MCIRDRPEATGQFYGNDALNEFDPLFEDMYDYCEAQQLDIDALTHEMRWALRKWKLILSMAIPCG